MMMVVDVVQLFFIRRPVIVAGVLLASLVFVYFLAQRYLVYVKELCGALLYTGGVVLAPLALAIHSLSVAHIILIMAFMLTALINLLLFTWFDHERDLQDKHQSFTTIFGAKATQTILSILFIVNASLSVLLIKDGVAKPAFIIIAMNGILLFILLSKNFFSVDDRYRLLGDAVFLLPAVYFFI
jgi:4-hydroxybenzoate polyprenyltransferase